MKPSRIAPALSVAAAFCAALPVGAQTEPAPGPDTPPAAPADPAASGPAPAAPAAAAPASAPAAPPAASTPASAPAKPPQGSLDAVTITGRTVGKGEARANSVVDSETIRQQAAGLDPLKMLNRVPGLQVGSSDALTGSFSMRLSMRGLNKEQIGVSIDGIPNGSTLSNGGTLPNRLVDPANLSRITVSQTAGDIGTPSSQALGGFIDFATRDPGRDPGTDAELALGNYGYRRGFARYDTGELAPGLRAYGHVTQEEVRTWPNDQSGRNRRSNLGLRLLQALDGGSSLRFTVGYNDLSSNDYDAVALRAVSAPFYKANFESNPGTDGLTDAWTGDPAVDQNNRSTRGIDSEELFMHAAALVQLEGASVSIKPYIHRQHGNGWFYVPYMAAPVNGQTYNAVAPGGRPVATVQECFANQYQRTASGALTPTPGNVVVFPPGVTADSLRAAGCPAAAPYVMNPREQWGAREASTRRGGYELDRKGTLGELKTGFDNHELRIGGWYEHIDRAKTRNWYLATDPAASAAYDESSLYSVTQDRQYRSVTKMLYAQDKILLLEDRLELDLGATYQRFSETYRSPVEFAGARSLKVSSGLLPKLAGLYRIDDDWEAFASASKNFSAIPDSVFEGTSAIDAKNGIQPETSINKDLGLRWQRGPAAVAAQVYDIDYRNRISIQNGNPNGDIFSRDATTTFVNQGGISSRGAEVTVRYEREAWQLYANYGYNRAVYEEDTPTEGIRAGDPVLGAARHNAFLEAQYRPDARWRVGANLKHVGKAAGTYGEVNNTATPAAGDTLPREYMPAYTLVGVSATYKLPPGTLGAGSSELAFNVDNLFDKRYLGGVGAELTTSDPIRSGRYFLGSPRSLFASWRARF